MSAAYDETKDANKVYLVDTYGFSNRSIVSNVTTSLKSGSGVLHSLSIGGISGPTVNIYDSLTATGTLITRILPNSPRQTYLYDVNFSTGLVVEPLPGDIVVPIQVSYK